MIEEKTYTKLNSSFVYTNFYGIYEILPENRKELPWDNNQVVFRVWLLNIRLH